MISNRLKIVLGIFFIFLFSFAKPISDYDIVQQFKKSVSAITVEIRNSTDSTLTNELKLKIDELKQNSIENKALLNNAIYPETFGSVFAKLNKEISQAKTKNILSSNLETVTKEKDSMQVVLIDYSGKITELTNENSSLIGKIRVIKKSMKNDKNAIFKYKRLIEKLKNNVETRNILVASIVDSLFKNMEKSKGGDVKRLSLVRQIDENSIMETIVNSIDGNIAFMKNSSLSQDDLDFVLDEYSKFTKTWKRISIPLTKTYYEGAKSEMILKAINSKLKKWDVTIYSSLWNKLYSRFKEKGIKVKKFKSAKSFNKNLISYIDLKISGKDTKLYKVFRDSVWQQNDVQGWIGFLMDHRKLSKKQVAEIETKISEWNSFDSGEFMNQLIVGGAVLLFLILIVMFFKAKKKKNMIDDSSINYNQSIVSDEDDNSKER